MSGQSFGLGELVSFFIVFQNLFGIVKVSFWFPGVVSDGKSFPFDKEGMASSLLFVGDYGLTQETASLALAVFECL